MRLRFGECVLDSDTRELIRDGRTAHLSPKAFQLLDLLLTARPRAVSKAEIHEQLWPGTFVTDASLARLVADVRAAVGDDAREPRFVRTVFGHGYAFSGEATSLSSPAAAPSRGRLLLGGKEIPLREGETLLGRAQDASVVIESGKASRHHARIVATAAGILLEDLGSKNGTYLKGRRVEAPTPLSDGDEICIGPVLLVYRASSGASSTETQTSSASDRRGSPAGTE